MDMMAQTKPIRAYSYPHVLTVIGLWLPCAPSVYQDGVYDGAAMYTKSRWPHIAAHVWLPSWRLSSNMRWRYTHHRCPIR